MICRFGVSGERSSSSSILRADVVVSTLMETFLLREERFFCFPLLFEVGIVLIGLSLADGALVLVKKRGVKSILPPSLLSVKLKSPSNIIGVPSSFIRLVADIRDGSTENMTLLSATVGIGLATSLLGIGMASECL